MATKRKTKTVAKKKSVSAKPIKGKKAPAKKNITGKKPNKAQKKAVGVESGLKMVSKKKVDAVVKGKGKSSPVKNIKKSAAKRPQVEITHGPDLNLIPVKGNIHPARVNEGHLLENAFKHNEEIALHQEQQRVKAAMATRQNAKRIFRTPRHS